MIFWRSNSNPIALSFALLVVFILSQVAWAEESSDSSSDWPDEVEFKPTTGAPKYFEKTDNPLIQRYNATDPESSNNIPVTTTPKPKKKFSLRHPFGKKPPPPLREDQIVRVGPRDYPAATDPLLALPVSVQLDSVVKPGFYLVKQVKDDANTRQLTLMRENREMGHISLNLVSENKNSPLEQEVKKSPVPQTPVLSTVLSPKVANEQQTLVIVLKEGEKRYESAPVPVYLDTRHDYKD